MAAFLAVCIALSIVAPAVAYAVYTGVHGTVQTVGRDTAPSIVAAQHIQALAADADASALNAVLTSDTPSGPSWTQYRKDMNQIQNELVTASQNITYGDEERIPILTIARNLSLYEYTMGQTLGKTPAEGNSILTHGHQLFKQYIRPASVVLDRANYSHLSQRYQAHRSAFAWQMGLVLLVMLVLIGVLAVVQIYLFRRTHRLANPGFSTATVIALFLMVYTVVVLTASEAQLVAAKQDSFDSINALWAARAVAYTMNADESLYLLYYGNNTELAGAEADYTQLEQQLTSVDPQQAMHDAQNGTPFGGYLGDEMSNITYPGERDAALAAVTAWTSYTTIDKHMRQLLAQGSYQPTLTIDLGTNPGQSDWAFAQFDAALGHVIDINQTYFNRQISDAFGILGTYPFILIGSTLALIVACIFGMKPRLEEYWL
jgi:hypothetical protein